MKIKFEKTVRWMAKNIATTVFCLVVITLGTAIVARATVTGTTIGNSISTEGLTVNTATIGTLNGILKGTSGAVSAISAGTSGQYLKEDATWADLNQAAVAGLTTASSPTFAGLTAGGATGVAIGDGTISDPTGAISFGSNDLSTSGTIASTGAAERVQGTDAFIDFNEPTNLYSMRLGSSGGTYDEYIDIDFDTATANTITFTGDGSMIWDFNNIAFDAQKTLPESESSQTAFIFSSTDTGPTNTTRFGIGNTFLPIDVNNTSSFAMFNSLSFTDGISYSNAGGTALSNNVSLKGANASTFGSPLLADSTIAWGGQISGQTATAANLYGTRNTLRANTANDNEVLTVTDDYNAFWSRGLDSSGAISIGGDARHFYATDLSFGGTIAKQYGLHIENMTSGTANYGIVLDDGADGIYFGGTSGKKITGSTSRITLDTVMAITPQASAPASCSVGDVYVDSTGTASICFCNASNTWEKLNLTGGGCS